MASKPDSPLPETIIFQNDQLKLELHQVQSDDPNSPTATLAGLSEKTLYRDQHGKTYIVKLQKKRETKDIFADVVPEFGKLKEAELGQYERHLRELQDSHAFLQVLTPRVAKKIFGDALVIPNMYFSLEMEKVGKGKKPPSPQGPTLILSEALTGFDEFLSKSAVVKGKKKPKDWQNLPLPSRADLKLTDEQTRILGKLLGIALVMGHWDLLNNIDLSNAGLVKIERDSGSGESDKQVVAVPVIVDWGNCMGVGFKGLSAEESAFQNLELKSGEINLKNMSIEDFQHCLPFDEMVYPLLPRQIVKNLFDMTKRGISTEEDRISALMFEGFKEVCQVAEKALHDLGKAIPEAIAETLAQYTDRSDRAYVLSILNQEFFFSSEAELKKGQEYFYNLVNVLKGRINSLQEIRRDLENRIPLEAIAQKRLQLAKKSLSRFERKVEVEAPVLSLPQFQTNVTKAAAAIPKPTVKPPQEIKTEPPPIQGLKEITTNFNILPLNSPRKPALKKTQTPTAENGPGKPPRKPRTPGKSPGPRTDAE